MRPHIREFFAVCAANLPCPEPIIEVGAFQVAGQEDIADLRQLFPGKKFTGCDARPGTGVDRIEDIHAFTFQDGEAGTFLLADTFEHVADPIRAMGEIHRCLRDDGIVIFSSIMNFPIHGFPNDYWRFTPEAFRSLANKFPNSAIFYNGPEGFPHTVCGIAAKKPIDEALRVLIPLLAEIPVPAPLILEPRAASIIASLAAKLLPSGASAAPDASEFRGGLDQASQPGWLLVTGQWLDGWACMEGVSEVEVMAGGEVIHRARLRKPRPEAASRFGIDPSLPIAFHEQLNLSGRGDVTTTLKLVATDKAGSRRVLFEFLQASCWGASILARDLSCIQLIPPIRTLHLGKAVPLLTAFAPAERL